MSDEWKRGVQDALKIVNNRRVTMQALHHPPNAVVHPAVFATLDEITVFLQAMLERGEYASRTPVDGQ